MVIAVFCADIHLSHAPPVARSAETDWYAAMSRVLQQLRKIQTEHGNVPVFVAGDVFDRWNSPPELVNWAIEQLDQFDGELFAVPGQHDMPLHEAESLRRSAYWTLVLSGVLTDLSGHVYRDGRFSVHPAPWGKPVPAVNEADVDQFNVLLMHRYVWAEGACHAAASEEQHWRSFCRRETANLRRFSLVVTGDNHLPFERKTQRQTLFNCGALMPRKADERNVVPSVGLLHSDGTIGRRCLDVSRDVWLEQKKNEAEQIQSDALSDFLQDMMSLDTASIDFRRVLRLYLDAKSGEVREDTRRLLLEKLG